VTGRLDELQMVPLQSRQLRLRHATEHDARWLHRVLRRASSGFGSRVDLTRDARLLLLR
jgi:poly-gamma-glutamate synthesis protein (capsule biosynthesis protein)